MNFFIHTLGCKVNRYESNQISGELESLGFNLSSIDNADFIIVNSCAVTSESVRKTRQNINKFKKINPKTFLILTGCAIILDQFKFNNNIDLICSKENIVKDICNHFEIFYKKNNFNFCFNDRTRAFLKIEDGCDNFCSYCIIPFARGKIRSKSLEDIELESKMLSNMGFKEVVIVGINLGKYGLDIGINLIDAIKTVSHYFERIRISSLEPDTVNETFIEELSYYQQICPNFHLSLQSGSNRILKMMNRKYNSDHYMRIIEKFGEKFRDSTFTTDMIVGYPSESDNDFKCSIDMIEKIRFIKVNVFPYSPRPFTYASNLKQIDSKIKKERIKEMIRFSENVSKKKISDFIGNEFNVLFETEKNESYEGYSENYIKVRFKSNQDLKNKIKRVIFLPDMSYS